MFINSLLMKLGVNECDIGCMCDIMQFLTTTQTHTRTIKYRF